MSTPNPIIPDPLAGPTDPLPSGKRERGGLLGRRTRQLRPKRRFITRIFKR